MVTLDDGPGEQAFPVALATANGLHAMGVYSAEPSPGYGRFRFKAERVNKWNCVFRVGRSLCSATWVDKKGEPSSSREPADRVKR